MSENRSWCCDTSISPESNKTVTHSFGEIFKPNVLIAYKLVCWLVILVGMFMNSCTIYLYVTKRIQQTHFNNSLKHLSISSIVQYLGFIPFLVVNLKNIPEGDPLGSFVCGLTFGMTVFFGATFVSTYIVTFMSVERFRIIKSPIVSLGLTNKKNVKIYAALWLASIILLAPNLFTYKLNKNIGICTRSINQYGKYTIYIYGYLMVLIALPIPTFVMVTTYLLTIYQLYKKKSEARLRHRRQVVKVLGMLIVIFLIGWMPFGMNWLLSYLDYYRKDELYKDIRISRFSLVPALCVPILNVLIYGMTNMQFRRSFQMLVKKKKKPHIILHIIP